MNLWHDVRQGARKLRSSRGFAITSVLTMALGIGVTTAIFSVCDAMLWKPMPLPGLDKLVMIMRGVPDDPNEWNEATPAEVRDIRRQAHSLNGFASWEGGAANLSGSGEPDRVLQSMVTANFFSVVGVPPVRGRAFQDGEDQPGREREAILSDGLWRRRFGANPSIVGQSVRIDDQNYTVIGIMPSSFDFPLATELWTPLALSPEDSESRSAQTLQSIARLKPGYTVKQAAADVDGIAGRLAKAYPDTNKNQHFVVLPALRFLVDHETEQYLVMLLGSVLFVLLIACVNVANLQFAHATGRLREVALRRALGASRWRVISQLVVESVLIALVGAICGLVVAKWGINVMRAGMPPEIARYILGWKDLQLDDRALFFTLAAAIASGIISGLAPAWQCSQPNLVGALKEGGRSSSVGKGRQRVRGALVAAEIALAVVLLVGAGLMVRGFGTLIARGEAMEPSTLLTLRLAITEQRYREPHQVAGFYREVVARIKALPGVRTAAAVTALPYSDHSSGRDFVIEGKPVDPGNHPNGMYQVTTHEYFDALHIPLQKGRLLTESDGAGAPKVVLISERMEQRWWPNESPLGKRININPTDPKNQWMTIVGVVGDVMHDPYERKPRPTLYLPYEQAPALWMDVGVRTNGDPLRLAPAIRAAVRTIDPDQPVTDVRSVEQSIHDRAIGLNYVAALMGVFGAVALLLSAVGVYGVMAHMVSEQTQEIGIRVALGAPRSNVLTMIFRRGLLTTGLGLVVGLPVAYLLARLMASLIYGISATDPGTFIGISVTLLAVATLAIYVPARRATKIDPIVALRYE
jgi:putative ABC transport system permease protein